MLALGRRPSLEREVRRTLRRGPMQVMSARVAERSVRLSPVSHREAQLHGDSTLRIGLCQAKRSRHASPRRQGAAWLRLTKLVAVSKLRLAKLVGVTQLWVLHTRRGDVRTGRGWRCLQRILDDRLH